jgi:hypothetical protein
MAFSLSVNAQDFDISNDYSTPAIVPNNYNTGVNPTVINGTKYEAPQSQPYNLNPTNQYGQPTNQTQIITPSSIQPVPYYDNMGNVIPQNGNSVGGGPTLPVP